MVAGSIPAVETMVVFFGESEKQVHCIRNGEAFRLSPEDTV
jgi:hypothetical protein